MTATSNDDRVLEPNILEIGNEIGRDFVESASSLFGGTVPKLSIFRDKNILAEIKELGRGHFGSVIDSITQECGDPTIGIAALDVPKIKDTPATEDSFWGIVMLMAVASNVMRPAIDHRNRTPFSLYNASAKNESKLTRAGLSFYTPEGKLGFHNDGRIEDGKFFVPNTILVYNIHIAYRRPGCFHWLPFERWSERTKFMELFGLGRRYRFQITPIVYSGENNGLDIVGPTHADLPVFSRTPSGEDVVFINGDITGPSDESTLFDNDLVEQFKESFLKNPFRFSVPQRPRRAVFLANAHGCHARDIFEEPRDSRNITRSFLRSVDLEGLPVAP